MDTRTLSDDLRRYLGMFLHWAWLLILLTVLAGVAAYVISRRTTPVYQASTRLLVNEAPATRSTDYASLLVSERLARTYSELLTTNPVLNEVINRLGLSNDARGLRRNLQVELVRDTQLIDVRVEDTNPVRAADIANMIVLVFAEQNQDLQASRYAKSKESLATQLTQIETQIEETNTALVALEDTAENRPERNRMEAALAQYRQTYASLLQSYEQVRLAEASSSSNVVQAEPASPPSGPIRPRTLMNTALAAIVGLMLAVGFILLVEALDDTLHPDDITRDMGLPVLGVIARYQINPSSPVVNIQPRSPVSEAFRALRTNIQFASVDWPVTTLLVTSPSPEDGKSTVAVNLSASLAQSGRRVILVEGDLRRPQVHKKLGLPNRNGISALFVHPVAALDGTLQKTEVPGLLALTSGVLPPNPAELLGSERMVDIIHQVKENTDVVVIDSPPVNAVTDASVLAPRVDGVLLIVRPGVTKAAACRQAVEQLQRVGAHILGVVLNDVEMKRSSYKYAYYRSYYQTYYKYYGHEAESKPITESH